MDLHELESKTVNELRELAKGYDDITGVAGLKKEELTDFLCKKLSIDRQRHVPKGIGRQAMKEKIRLLQGKRAQILEAHDRQGLAEIRREIKSYKRKLRRLVARALRQSSAHSRSST
ncbi:MAG: Rho termination factor N-terminal domain-containing protein [Acidobacteriota bacterium]